MNPVSTSVTPRRAAGRRALAAACALGLSVALGACSVTLQGGQRGAAASHSQQTGSAGSQTASGDSSADESPDEATESASASPSPSQTPSPTPSPLAPIPTAPTDGSRPGAQASITNSDWIDAAGQTGYSLLRPRNGQLVVSRDSQTVVVEGDVTTLTINAKYATVIVDYAQNIIINGNSARVYVRDTEHVSFTSDYNELLWAGNTPYIDDAGNYNEARNQADVG